MRFEWDPLKNHANIRKHGIDFSDVPALFKGPMVSARDTRVAYVEERWVAIGWLASTLGVVVYLEMTTECIRVISARKATQKEARHYARLISH